MEDGGDAEGFFVDEGAGVGWELVDDGLAVEPGAHDVVEAFVGEGAAGEGDGGVDEGGVWDADAGDDAREEGDGDHFEGLYL